MPGKLTGQAEHTDGQVIVIMGPPNAGKDTQAHKLAQSLGGVYIGSGSLLRSEADPRLMAIMARGELVPAEDFRRLIGKAVAAVPLQRPVVLAGIAKRPEEARWIVEYLPSIGRWVDKVILLHISIEVAKQRSSARGHDRDDDNPEVQEHRWKQFFELTNQSLAYFKELGLLREVNGEVSEGEVTQLINAALK